MELDEVVRLLRALAKSMHDEAIVHQNAATKDTTFKPFYSGANFGFSACGTKLDMFIDGLEIRERGRQLTDATRHVRRNVRTMLETPEL